MAQFQPLVSVIIPNYCHSKFLDQRIQSVLDQTYQNFEVIILDDASPDDGASKAVIERYRENPHVSHIVYNEQNSGSTFIQWHKGFLLAKGDIVWIAESDDYCEREFLETLVPCWEKYPTCSIVQSSGWYAYPDRNEPCFNMDETYPVSFSDGKNCITRNFVLSCFFVPNVSAVTFKKETALSLPEDYMGFKSSGDRLFWIYMLERGDICTVNKRLNYYRQHSCKVSATKEYDGTQCRENYRINQYLHKQGYVRGLVAVREYIFYRNYILNYRFDSEKTRQELYELWFSKVERNPLYAGFVTGIWNIGTRLVHLCRKLF